MPKRTLENSKQRPAPASLTNGNVGDSPSAGNDTPRRRCTRFLKCWVTSLSGVMSSTRRSTPSVFESRDAWQTLGRLALNFHRRKEWTSLRMERHGGTSDALRRCRAGTYGTAQNNVRTSMLPDRAWRARRAPSHDGIAARGLRAIAGSIAAALLGSRRAQGMEASEVVDGVRRRRGEQQPSDMALWLQV
jgi:hypothetical protein